MGISLDLYPMHLPIDSLLHTKLVCQDQHKLFEYLFDNTGYFEPWLAIGKKAIRYWDEGIKDTRVDDYGEPLMACEAGKLVMLFEDFDQYEEQLYDQNKCVLQYLKACPEELPVVVFWT